MALRVGRGSILRVGETLEFIVKFPRDEVNGDSETFYLVEPSIGQRE